MNVNEPSADIFEHDQSSIPNFSYRIPIKKMSNIGVFSQLNNLMTVLTLSNDEVTINNRRSHTKSSIKISTIMAERSGLD